MKKIKWLAAFLAAVLIIGMLAGCSANPVESEAESVVEESEEEPIATPIPTTEPEVITPEPTPEEPQEDIPEGMGKSILTGEYIPKEMAERRPVAVMIENTKGSIPHWGCRNASVYLEAPVEAELTRECLFFEDYEDLERISSIRSCRDYFLSYAHGFDSIYVHWGQAAYAFVYLENDKTDNISALKSYPKGSYFFRVSDRVAPYNGATSGAKLAQAIEDIGYRKTIKEGFDATFDYLPVGETADMSSGRDAGYAATGYQSSHSYFIYNEEEGVYDRYEYGEAEIDEETGDQIKVKNVIFEYENASLYETSAYVRFETTGKGKGLYMTDGKAVDITWEREDYYSPAKYYLEDGTPLKMTPGKTFVCLIKNKHVGLAKVGASESEAECVVTPEVQAELEKENEEWESWFKEHEQELRDELDIDLFLSLEAHGNVSKCEP